MVQAVSEPDDIDRSARGLTTAVRHHECPHCEQTHFSSLMQQPLRCFHGSTYGVAPAGSRLRGGVQRIATFQQRLLQVA